MGKTVLGELISQAWQLRNLKTSVHRLIVMYAQTDVIVVTAVHMMFMDGKVMYPRQSRGHEIAGTAQSGLETREPPKGGTS